MIVRETSATEKSVTVYAANSLPPSPGYLTLSASGREFSAFEKGRP